MIVGAASWLLAADVQAANTAKPRVRASFLGVQCVQTIERGAPLRFDVGIPYEDDALTPDEPADSRTFQFFALCRDPGPLEALPPWIDADDVMRAQAVNAAIEDAQPQEILGSSSAWNVPGHGGAGSCVVPITSEDERMPITCDATREGFAWDGGDAPAGGYVVYGYTYEPAENVWSARGGVVRVVEPGDPDAAGPAVAFDSVLSQVDASLLGGMVVTGCVAGAEGTTVAVDWVTAPRLDDEGDSAWQALPEVEVDAGAFAAAFVPPPEAEFKAVFFRARAEDPQGRTFVAYTHHPVVVVPECAAATGGQYATIDSCGVGAPGDWSVPPVDAVDCEGGGTTSEASTSDGSTSSEDDGNSGTGEVTENDGAEGCGCGVAGARGLPWMLVPWLALRRRRASR